MSCNKCATSFKDNDTKHHCRAYGEGFCDSCSSTTQPVPERGWGPAPVRVCDNCYKARNSQLDVTEAQADDEGGTLTARKVGKSVQNTLGALVTANDIPLGLVKDAARPAYWVPDHEILHCHNCQKEFSLKLSKYHCWVCRQGFYDECSHDRQDVPSRGWDHPHAAATIFRVTLWSQEDCYKSNAMLRGRVGGYLPVQSAFPKALPTDFI
ncbi:hypothetical protein J1605_021222 [Eschrichtius robustus]|uniref:FYVE-type domain-containing protein n=1 Tax=Eschrichtius robustus TaxID=9764 RepID=A0AB34HGP8_ESCRO|nr:hypothetical protein J1605_021222 [Eschrichtius robustus]